MSFRLFNLILAIVCMAISFGMIFKGIPSNTTVIAVGIFCGIGGVFLFVLYLIGGRQ